MKLLGLFVLAVTAVLSNAISQGTISEHLPYVVLIESRNPSTGTARFGGGSLITQRHVLTAASNLFQFTQFIVSMGSALRSNMTVFPFASAVPHPQFNQAQNINNIGVITLQNDVPFSSIFQPISLSRYNMRLNEQGMIAGFGGIPTLPSQKLYAAFPRVVTGANCLARWPGTDLAFRFCAEDARLRSDFCEADIGSALTVLDRGVERMVGIASNAHCSPNTIPSQPSVYTSVIGFRSWILTQTGI